MSLPFRSLDCALPARLTIMSAQDARGPMSLFIVFEAGSPAGAVGWPIVVEVRTACSASRCRAGQGWRAGDVSFGIGSLPWPCRFGCAGRDGIIADRVHACRVERLAKSKVLRVDAGRFFTTVVE
jgi:hypothetical protein